MEYCNISGTGQYSGGDYPSDIPNPGYVSYAEFLTYCNGNNSGRSYLLYSP